MPVPAEPGLSFSVAVNAERGVQTDPRGRRRLRFRFRFIEPEKKRRQTRLTHRRKTGNSERATGTHPTRPATEKRSVQNANPQNQSPNGTPSPGQAYARGATHRIPPQRCAPLPFPGKVTRQRVLGFPLPDATASSGAATHECSHSHLTVQPIVDNHVTEQAQFPGGETAVPALGEGISLTRRALGEITLLGISFLFIFSTYSALMLLVAATMSS